MHSTMFSGAAVLLALAPTALALGSASVTNSCGFSVWYASIDGTAEGLTEMAPGGSMAQAWASENTGVSIKMALNDTLSGPISQFEFTWASGSIFYDLSNINGDGASGYPFSAGGISITPSVAASAADPTCVPVDCPAGTTVCTAAYNAPNDPRTLVCNEDTSLSLVLCPGQGWKRDTHVHASSHNARQVRRPHGRAWVKV